MVSHWFWSEFTAKYSFGWDWVCHQVSLKIKTKQINKKTPPLSFQSFCDRVINVCICGPIKICSLTKTFCSCLLNQVGRWKWLLFSSFPQEKRKGKHLNRVWKWFTENCHKYIVRPHRILWDNCSYHFYFTKATKE